MTSGIRTTTGAAALALLLAGCSTTVDESKAPERTAQIKKDRDLVRTTIVKEAKAVADALGAEVVAATGRYRVSDNMDLARPDAWYTADAVIRMPADAPKPYSFRVAAALRKLGYEPSLSFSTSGGGGGGDERDGLFMGYGESSTGSYRDLKFSIHSDDVEIPDSVADEYGAETLEPILGDPEAVR